jgi:hypothetical protein
MHNQMFSTRAFLLAAVIVLQGTLLTSCGGAEQASAGEQVEGLWRYTGLTASDGRDLSLTGIFLFKDGMFLQQSIFNGEPFEEQDAMAHAGPYASSADSVQLVAEQTIAVSPRDTAALSFLAHTEHDLSVTRSDENLRLVFGSGTVQEFVRIGAGDGEVYELEGGAFSLTDGFFILVHGNESNSVSGFGTFERSGEELTLHIERWTEANRSEARNLRDTVMRAAFDGTSLTLADGRVFRVTQ